jgi:hypothetical protein
MEGRSERRGRPTMGGLFYATTAAGIAIPTAVLLYLFIIQIVTKYLGG